jgi:hypothetical protein
MMESRLIFLHLLYNGRRASCSTTGKLGGEGRLESSNGRMN